MLATPLQALSNGKPASKNRFPIFEGRALTCAFACTQTGQVIIYAFSGPGAVLLVQLGEPALSGGGPDLVRPTASRR